MEKATKHFQQNYADAVTFNALKNEINKFIDKEASQHAIKLQRTPAAVKIHYECGILPVRNFSGGDLEDIDQLYLDKHLEIIKKRGISGQSCQARYMVRCSNQFFDHDDDYIIGGLGYETIALGGANTAITDFGAITRIDRICDDLGIDSIETGATIAICVDGGKIPWGDVAAAIDLIREMADGTQFGRLMGEGAEVVGKHLGVSRIPVAKHLAFPGYDIRDATSKAVAFGGGSQGADHTACLSIGAFEELPYEEICQISYHIQREFAMLDSLICIFALM